MIDDENKKTSFSVEKKGRMLSHILFLFGEGLERLRNLDKLSYIIGVINQEYCIYQ